MDNKTEIGKINRDEYMKAVDIDSNGIWLRNGVKIPLLGSTLPIPESARLRSEPEFQEVLYMTTALLAYEYCPSCTEPFDETFPMLVTDQGAKMIPARCCDTFIWMTDKLGEEYDGSSDT